MKNKELVAKAVFGQITLGEVINKFGDKISRIFVESDYGEFDGSSYSKDTGEEVFFVVDKKNKTISFHSSYQIDLQLDLSTKVKVKPNEIEIENEEGRFVLTFIETKVVSFESILPQSRKNQIRESSQAED